ASILQQYCSIWQRILRDQKNRSTGHPASVISDARRGWIRGACLSFFLQEGVMKAKLLFAVGALVIGSLLAGPAAADKVKIDFWYGNSGDISKRVQEVCQHFNDSQKDFEVACTSQD